MDDDVHLFEIRPNRRIREQLLGLIDLHLRLRAFGTGTTTLQGKVWLDGATEPTVPTLTITDTTAALQNPGTAGLYTFLSSSATNAPVVASYDDFSVVPFAGP